MQELRLLVVNRTYCRPEWGQMPLSRNDNELSHQFFPALLHSTGEFVHTGITSIRCYITLSSELFTAL